MSASLDLDFMKGRLRLFLTTYGQRGSSGTVPVFFLSHEDKVYFTTRKAQLIKTNPRVTVRIGSRSELSFEGRAFWLEDPALYDFTLSRYRRKHWFLSLFVRALRRRKERGESTAVKIVFGKDAQPEPTFAIWFLE